LPSLAERRLRRRVWRSRFHIERLVLRGSLRCFVVRRPNQNVFAAIAKNVFAAIARSDVAVAFGRVEPPQRTPCHVAVPFDVLGNRYLRSARGDDGPPRVRDCRACAANIGHQNRLHLPANNCSWFASGEGLRLAARQSTRQIDSRLTNVADLRRIEPMSAEIA